MSEDIQHILDEWSFEPDQLQVRLITGDDGRERIQMRMDLGLIQMDLEGRPDGQRPEGHESLLEFYETKARLAKDKGSTYSLESSDCAQLMREGLQYYHRYLSAFQLGRYDLVARDTQRNLRLFAFVRAHATSPRDKLDFDQYRPYVQMMLTRATASQAIQNGEISAALTQIDDGIKAIRSFLREYNQREREAECSELVFLLRWRREVERERPISPLERLEQQLEASVELENYEEAARIRDQIRRLQETDSR